MRSYPGMQVKLFRSEWAFWFRANLVWLKSWYENGDEEQWANCEEWCGWESSMMGMMSKWRAHDWKWWWANGGKCWRMVGSWLKMMMGKWWWMVGSWLKMMMGEWWWIVGSWWKMTQCIIWNDGLPMGNSQLMVDWWWGVLEERWANGGLMMGNARRTMG